MLTTGTQASPNPVKGRYHSTSKYISVDRPEGVIGLFHKHRRPRHSYDIARNNAEGFVFESFSAAVYYTPRGPLPKTKIVTRFQQSVGLQLSTSLVPTLTYCAMIPHDAEIFHHILLDDVHGIHCLIENGLASLSDCDPEGRPLLFVRVLLNMLCA